MAISSSKGTVVKFGDGPYDESNFSGTIVACATSWSKTGGDVEQLDSTCLNESGSYRTQVPGFIATGSISIEGYFGKEDYAALKAIEGVADKALEITLPDGSKEGGSGTLGGLSMTAAVGAIVTFSATFSLSGGTTFTPAA